MRRLQSLPQSNPISKIHSNHAKSKKPVSHFQNTRLLWKWQPRYSSHEQKPVEALWHKLWNAELTWRIYKVQNHPMNATEYPLPLPNHAPPPTYVQFYSHIQKKDWEIQMHLNLIKQYFFGSFSERQREGRAIICCCCCWHWHNNNVATTDYSGTFWTLKQRKNCWTLKSKIQCKGFYPFLLEVKAPKNDGNSKP